MLLFKTSLRNLRKNKLMNLITLLEITAVIIIMIIMVSSILIRYKYYSPFKDMFESNGILCEFTGMANKNIMNGSPFEDFVCNDEIFEELHSPDNIAACNKLMGTVQSESGEFYSTNNYCYNDEIIRRFKPSLTEGRWLNTSENANTIEAVVSKNDYGWKTGDKINFLFYNWPDSVSMEIEIVGVLEDNTKIPGGFAVHGGNDDFNMFFNTYDYDIEEVPLILFSSEYLSALKQSGEIIEAMFSYSIITYPDSITDEELEADQKLLNSYGCAYSVKLKELDKNSKLYLYHQVYNMLPIIIVILILTFVSSISCTALSTRRRLRDYSIYYICGLQWKQCILINLIQSVIISAVSLILSVVTLKIITLTPLNNVITIVWGGITITSVFIMIALFLLISMLMPIIIIGKSTPKEILTR